ncbi:hypothetical protein BDA99DRAFT_523503 [Phascolomyces articulosus]|uniref:F-box domain-containing protein n=1 Tax=Phascolomyces articulosus TaxID=60185 RepID=A0AAD5P9L9_9FUNG|nr:hypothetical protein BDA99DRAFT_523503 [Phascolomyces articulosus]
MEQQQQHQQLSWIKHPELNITQNKKTKSIQDIPREILYLIFVWLTGADIENIGKCSRTLQLLIQDDYMWNAMTKVRFPRLYEETLNEMRDGRENKPLCWRDIYMVKDENRLSAAEHMVITHIKLPYWRIVHSNESLYGATAKLHSVCWFDVRGLIEGVPPGKYRVQWRMRLSLSARWNEAFEFTASIIPRNQSLTPDLDDMGGEKVVSYITPPKFYAREDVVTNTWILVTIPGEIEIKDGYADIRVSHEKKTNFWKAGIELDWVRLVPASETTSDGLLIDYESRHTFYWRTSHGMRTSSSSHDLTTEDTVYNNNGMWSSSWCGDSDNDGSVDDFWNDS